jgi:hypothetical protein
MLAICLLSFPLASIFMYANIGYLLIDIRRIVSAANLGAEAAVPCSSGAGFRNTSGGIRTITCNKTTRLVTGGDRNAFRSLECRLDAWDGLCDRLCDRVWYGKSRGEEEKNKCRFEMHIGK